MAKTLRITLVRSGIGRPEVERRTIKALGLGKLNSSVVQDDNPAIRGMAFKIRHLVSVEEIDA